MASPAPDIVTLVEQIRADVDARRARGEATPEDIDALFDERLRTYIEAAKIDPRLGVRLTHESHDWNIDTDYHIRTNRVGRGRHDRARGQDAGPAVRAALYRPPAEPPGADQSCGVVLSAGLGAAHAAPGARGQTPAARNRICSNARDETGGGDPTLRRRGRRRRGSALPRAGARAAARARRGSPHDVRPRLHHLEEPLPRRHARRRKTFASRASPTGASGTCAGSARSRTRCSTTTTRRPMSGSGFSRTARCARIWSRPSSRGATSTIS